MPLVRYRDTNEHHVAGHPVLIAIGVVSLKSGNDPGVGAPGSRREARQVTPVTSDKTHGSARIKPLAGHTTESDSIGHTGVRHVAPCSTPNIGVPRTIGHIGQVTPRLTVVGGAETLTAQQMQSRDDDRDESTDDELPDECPRCGDSCFYRRGIPQEIYYCDFCAMEFWREGDDWMCCGSGGVRYRLEDDGQIILADGGTDVPLVFEANAFEDSEFPPHWDDSDMAFLAEFLRENFNSQLVQTVEDTEWSYRLFKRGDDR